MKRIGFDTARLRTINPGAFAALPKNATQDGVLSFYYTYDGELRATDNTVTYAYLKGAYNQKRKRFDYSWQNITDSLGKTYDALLARQARLK